MNAASGANPQPAKPGVVAFGSLIDLARLQTGDATAEICEACSTINLGSAKFCKGCDHKLPAFYSDLDDDPPDSPTQRLRKAPTRGWASGLMALWMALLSLAAFAAFATLTID